MIITIDNEHMQLKAFLDLTTLEFVPKNGCHCDYVAQNMHDFIEKQIAEQREYGSSMGAERYGRVSFRDGGEFSVGRMPFTKVKTDGLDICLGDTVLYTWKKQHYSEKYDFKLDVAYHVYGMYCLWFRSLNDELLLTYSEHGILKMTRLFTKERYMEVDCAEDRALFARLLRVGLLQDVIFYGIESLNR